MISRRRQLIVVASVFVVMSVSTGTGFYALGIFAKDLEDRAGFSLSINAAGATIFLLGAGVCGLVVPPLITRFGIRGLMLVGAVAYAAFFPLLGQAREPWQLLAVYAAGGCASMAVSIVPASIVILQWFGAGPAKPLMIASTGISVGGVVIAPPIAVWVESQGLRTVGPMLGLVVAVVLLPLVLILTRPDAPRLGVGTPVHDTGAEPVEPPEAPRYAFPLTCLAFSFMLMSQVAVITTLLNIMDAKDLLHASLTLSIMTFASIVGRLVGIPAMELLGVRVLSISIAGLQALAMLVFAAADSQLEIRVGAVLLGITVGNTVVLMPLWLLGLFGGVRYPRLYARANLVTTLGTAAAPSVIAGLHGLLGGFSTPLTILAAGSFAAALLLTMVPAPRVAVRA